MAKRSLVVLTLGPVEEVGIQQDLFSCADLTLDCLKRIFIGVAIPLLPGNLRPVPKAALHLDHS